MITLHAEAVNDDELSQPHRTFFAYKIEKFQLKSMNSTVGAEYSDIIILA